MINKSASLLMAMLVVASVSRAAELFVAPQGNDANPGTKTQPLATISAAVQRLAPGDSVVVRGGTYRETVRFPRSGTADRPIVVKAERAEKVIVSGFDLLGGWKKSGSNVWSAPTQWTLGRGKDQLFYNGAPMIEARHPNVPEAGLALAVSGLNPLHPQFAAFSATPSNRVAGAAARAAKDGYWDGAIYYGVHWDGWSAQTGIIGESKADGTLLIKKATARWWFGNGTPKPWLKGERGRGMIVSHRNALDAEGEWFRASDGALLFIPPHGDNPDGKAEFKRRQLAFDLANQSHIRIEGIHVIGASASLRNSESCVLDGCTFDYFTHFTLFDDARNGQIDRLGDRRALEAGEVAIVVGGRKNSVKNCRFSHSAGGGIYLEGYGHVLHNNLIEEVSYTCTYLAGVMVGWNGEIASGGHTITFNTLRRSGRALLHLDGSYQTRHGGSLPFAGMLIAHNHFHDGMLQGRDGGLLNSYCTDAGAYGRRTEFHHNVIHDGHDPMVIEAGWPLGLVYWDNYTFNMSNHHNLLWASPGTMDIPVLLNTPSVNNSWEDNNRFLKGHEGGVAALKPQDYPDEMPFAYGHDFANPPAVPSWEPKVVAAFAFGHELTPGGHYVQRGVSFPQPPQTIAVRFACDDKQLNQNIRPRTARSSSGSRECLALDLTELERSPKLRLKYGTIQRAADGEYLKVSQLDLGRGYEQLYFLWASGNPVAKSLEIRLDDLNSQSVARFDLPDTHSSIVFDPGNRGLYPFNEFRQALPAALSGKHDVYFVFRGSSADELGQLASVRFEKYRGKVELLPNEARLELRLGHAEGELIATVFPQATEGGLCETVAMLNRSVTGLHDLHFSLRAARPTSIRVDTVRFETTTP